MKTQKQIALDAAKALREIGWTRGHFVRYNEDPSTSRDRPYTGFCAVGAIRHAVGWYGGGIRTAKDMYEVRMSSAFIKNRIEEMYFNGENGALIDFNDSSDSMERVIAVFEAAATSLPDEPPPIPEFIPDEDY